MGLCRAVAGCRAIKRQIERLETAIDLSSDWLEIQYLMGEPELLKALYKESESEAA